MVYSTFFSVPFAKEYTKLVNFAII